MKLPILLIAVITFFFVSCSRDDLSSQTGADSSSWDIPEDEVLDGGPGKDGIPALTEPLFIPASEASYLSGDQLVLGYKDGSDIRAYPITVLDWHEIVNDKVNDFAFSVNYCPLTGTGIGWGREINGVETTFGVSGLLYNSNLILYDRETDSYWSQILLRAVHGELRGMEAKTFQLVETTWATWKQMYPETTVISTETGYSRPYGFYPYRNYREDHNYFLFPFSPEDDRLDAKERVHGVIKNGSAKAYRFETFAEGLTIVEDVLMGEPVVVAGNNDANFIVSFNRTLTDGTVMTFNPVSANNPLSAIMSDQEGNTWDVFGVAISGPREGQRLTSTTSFMGYWFAWGAFYPDLLIYGE
jgi:hypothetical protein